MDSRFRFIKELGRGGQGQVWLVEDGAKGGVSLALKRVSKNEDRDILGAEFRLLAALRHPNLAGAVDFFVDEEGPYFTCEYVNGLDLLTFARTAGEAGVMRAVASLLRALALIHSRGFVHGDVSPGNILMERAQGDEFQLKLLDLGNAGTIGSPPPVTTAGYSAPEVLKGEGARVSSDLYSVGALIGTLAFATPPFGEGDASQIVQAQLKGATRLPDGENAPLAALCLELLHLDPAERPQSADQVLRRLAEISEVEIELGLWQVPGATLPSPAVVGRRHEAALVEESFNQAEAGTAAPVVRVLGPPGSGKSTFLNEMVHIAQLAGFTIVGGGGEIPSFAHLAESIRSDLGDLPAGSSQWAESAQFAAVEVIAQRAKDAPVCIVIDDLDRGDEWTRDMAETFARWMQSDGERPPRVVMLTASRDGAREGTREGVGGQDVYLPLHPLSKAHTGALVESMLPGLVYDPAIVDAVYVASKGSPGDAEQFVRLAAGHRGQLDLVALTEDVVARLGKTEQRVLSLFSLTERSLSRAHLISLFGEGPSGEGNWMENLLSGGFLSVEEGAGGGRLRAGTQVASVAKRRVGLAKARADGRKMAALLAKDGEWDIAAQIAVAMGDGADAVRYYSSHGTACFEGKDLTGAAASFEEALRLIPKEQSLGSFAPLAVETFETIGKYELALRCLGGSAIPKEEKERRTLHLLFMLGRHEEVHAAAARLAKKDPSDLQVIETLARAEMQLGRYEVSLATVKQALKRAPTVLESGSLRAALARTGAVDALYLGRLEEAEGLLQEAQTGFEKAGDLDGEIKVLSDRGMIARRRGDLKGALALYDRVVSQTQQLGNRRLEGLHLMNRATVALMAGDIHRAHVDYNRAHTIAVVLGNDFAAAQVEVNLADLLSGLGDQGGALKMAGRAATRCRRMGQLRLEARARLTAGVALLRSGDLFAARKRMVQAKKRFEAEGDDVGRISAELSMAELALLRGDGDQAVDWANRALSLSRNRGIKVYEARALILKARGDAAVGGDLKNTLPLYDEALAILEQGSLPDEIWRARVHHATALEAAGYMARAAEVRQQAMAGFARVLEGVPLPYQERFGAYGEAVTLGGAAGTTGTKETLVDHRGRDLARLMEVNRELTRERDLKRLLSLIMSHAVDLTGAERGMVVMKKGADLESVISYQISDAEEVSFSRSIAEQVLKEDKTVLAIDALGDDRFSAFASVHAMKLRSILAVPLRIRDQRVGVIYLDSKLRTGVFEEGDRALLEAFGAQAAIALETARLISENERRCADLENANGEIRVLTGQLEDKLRRNEAALKDVGALLSRTQKEEASRLRANGIIGRSRAMVKVMHVVDRIAVTDVPVYIFGASGTGKELVARAIHAESVRQDKTFVPVNCGALPPKLLASELFGHTKGSFTGAYGDRPGLFRLAHEGTLFLDEVSNMDAEMQAYLLRVLQDGTFRSLGASEEVSVDVRVISASNRDLKEEVAAGRFREDLFYRLNVVRLEVPTLAERSEDIPMLVEHFAAQYGKDRAVTFSREAMDRLVAAPWKGNVRELENEVIRAITLSSGTGPIEPGDLSPRIAGGSPSISKPQKGTLKERVNGFERIIIEQMLEACGQNATNAAKKLGISRAGLYKKLEKHGVR